MKKHTLEHLNNIPLWVKLEQNPKKELILDQQGIRGLYEMLFSSNEQTQFKLQKRRNLHYIENAHKFLSSLSESSQPVYLLKGACFLGELYPTWGERFMSDIDIYCQDMPAMEEAALSYGMKRTNSEESYWIGNAHKREFYLETNLGNIPFEFHSKLFWHCDDPDEISYHNFCDSYGLGLEESLVFLIGHYAFQHTCQKLYWLFDIYLFILRFGSEIDYEKFLKLIDHFGFKRSLQFTKSLLESAFAFSWSQVKGSSSFLLREDFLFEDSQRHWYYLSLKWYLKNGLRTNFRYNFEWAKSKVS